MKPTNPDDHGPAMTLYFVDGMAFRAGFLLLRNQALTLGIVGAIFGDAPDAVPDDEWLEWLGKQWDYSQARAALGPEFDALASRLVAQQQMAARFGEAS